MVGGEMTMGETITVFLDFIVLLKCEEEEEKKGVRTQRHSICTPLLHDAIPNRALPYSARLTVSRSPNSVSSHWTPAACSLLCAMPSAATNNSDVMYVIAARRTSGTSLRKRYS